MIYVLKGAASVPRVWLVPEADGEMVMYPYEHSDGLPVEMNGALHRQIVAANKKYWKYQTLLHQFYTEAFEHPETIRRVR